MMRDGGRVSLDGAGDAEGGGGRRWWLVEEKQEMKRAHGFMCGVGPTGWAASRRARGVGGVGSRIAREAAEKPACMPFVPRLACSARGAA